MKKILVVLVVSLCMTTSCSKLLEDLKKADMEDIKVMKWDSGEWDTQEWGH